MQTFIRKELDMKYPINLRRLSPIMKIYAGFVSQWHQTKIYQNKQDKRKEAANAARVQRDEKLKESLLAVIYRELDQNVSMKAKGEESREVIVQVQSRFIHSLDRVLQSKEFLTYNIERIEEDVDLRIAFPDMPILLRVVKRAL